MGILGLGPVDNGGPSPSSSTSILQQMKQAGKIVSNSFGLHIGSAKHGQPGSLTLGGFDKSRAVGPVGSFPYSSGIPVVTLRDVVLGTESGGSPFNESGIISVHTGVGNGSVGQGVSNGFGLPTGAIVVIPNPSVPYLYLPYDTCFAAAQYLPVTYNAGLGLFMWNVDDPKYRRIVSSPSYMGFVLSDMSAQNVTIKVPFQLLNLTLESPLVETPTQYFPVRYPNNSAPH